MPATIRDAFVSAFGGDDARKLEIAALEHENHDNKGSDPFKWTLLICLGYQCMEVDRYRKHHGIETPPWADLRQWIIDHADLGTHDGDFDYIGAYAGAYNDFIKPKAETH